MRGEGEGGPERVVWGRWSEQGQAQLTHSAPDDDKQRDTVVSQKASGPSFEIQPRPGLSDRETGPQDTHGQDEPPQAIDKAPVEVIGCTTAAHRQP
ncbi:MAG: hypothetical protein FRX49_06585 [Trebouxia sp. A1-2]|nr:MAG: hypothetical protein FRX49_06585 [Trebouxia sp. A1-2]